MWRSLTISKNIPNYLEPVRDYVPLLAYTLTGTSMDATELNNHAVALMIRRDLFYGGTKTTGPAFLINEGTTLQDPLEDQNKNQTNKNEFARLVCQVSAALQTNHKALVESLCVETYECFRGWHNHHALILAVDPATLRTVVPTQTQTQTQNQTKTYGVLFEHLDQALVSGTLKFEYVDELWTSDDLELIKKLKAYEREYSLVEKENVVVTHDRMRFAQECAEYFGSIAKQTQAQNQNVYVRGDLLLECEDTHLPFMPSHQLWENKPSPTKLETLRTLFEKTNARVVGVVPDLGDLVRFVVEWTPLQEQPLV
jgi:hypothetical protein